MATLKPYPWIWGMGGMRLTTEGRNELSGKMEDPRPAHMAQG